jgi:hypothetical protein
MPKEPEKENDYRYLAAGCCVLLSIILTVVLLVVLFIALGRKKDVSWEE